MSEEHSERKSDSPVVQMLVSMSGASAPEHETDPPGVEEQSVKVGHEPDRFGIKGILMVPAAVVALLVFAYIVISSIFGWITTRNAVADANANPITKAINDEPIDKRFGRISSTDVTAPVPQPRLEMLRETKAPDTPQDPPYLRSKQPIETPGVNPPEIRPESLRPDNYTDPATGAKVLIETAPVGPAGSGLIRIPISEAIALLAVDSKKHQHGLIDQYVPVQKKPIDLPRTTRLTPKLSNGGLGGPSDPPPAMKNPTPKKKHDH